MVLGDLDNSTGIMIITDDNLEGCISIWFIFSVMFYFSPVPLKCL